MSEEVLVDWLEGVSPLQGLDRERLEALVAEAEVERHEPRSVIFQRGDRDAWTRYVLSGEVVLATGPGEPVHSVVGLGDAGVAAEPIGMDDVHTCNALARTAVKLIRVPTGRIRALLDEIGPGPASDYEVDEIGAADESDELYSALIADLLQDRLDLPTMPDVAVRVRSAIADERAGAPEVTRIIQADPAVAARVLQAANSALYRGERTVDSLNQAVVRLGLRNVRELVTAVTMREVFKSKNTLLNERMLELWQHSALVAATCAVMARRLSGFDSDRALLAGLIHDIGVVPMLAHASEYPGLSANPGALEQAIAAHRDDLGAMILRRWNFSDEMVDVALLAEEWSRESEGGADYADLVIAAQLECLGGGGPDSELPALETVPVYERLGLASIASDTGETLLEEAHDEIGEIQSLLMG
ncbi:HDOD domain-containing protein [Arhodomonas aquaeolei]|uniref:HDOD domain-containing protein n=1 Tax=Arhodomonas aquaeolei TaxID=2369 RepID=UPI000378DB9F|nr:HDOD domain-containing protein [Arhodomonas aquaeolei]